ncbi:hypothetical protein CHS0354_031489 [Potamilus streckersoni]|uniref:Uncharacterized protein n=1 Tax=Potamilus streckersoni TaxID=2493646 RepID=A0AAE0SH82_9BIVA|nr:hypothetical protein CHS0354_031489 [Potamilus streckersoni]
MEGCYVLLLFFLSSVIEQIAAQDIDAISGNDTVWQPETCRMSSDCTQDFCCRDKFGKLLDMSGTFDHIGPIHINTNGTCHPVRAQLGEHCSKYCPCDKSQGLLCFRSLKLKCCEPYTCHRKEEVDSQIKNFMKCYKDPACQLPL